MSLANLLEQQLQESMTRIPPEAIKVMQQSTQELEQAGVGNSALKAGDQLPAATLLDHQGNSVALSSLLEQGPLVINFYRGGWCPYCNLELQAYQNQLDAIQALGGQLVAVTPEKPDNSLSTIEKNELAFPVLTDEGHKLAESLGIAFEFPASLQELYKGFGLDLPGSNADSRWMLPIPATFVVNRNADILLSHVDLDYTKRLEPSEAVEALKQAT